MVLPERERPGNTAMAWAMPMMNASIRPMCSRSRGREKYENERRTAVTSRQMPTTIRLLNAPSTMSLSGDRPTMPTGIMEMMMHSR